MKSQPTNLISLVEYLFLTCVSLKICIILGDNRRNLRLDESLKAF